MAEINEKDLSMATGGTDITARPLHRGASDHTSVSCPEYNAVNAVKAMSCSNCVKLSTCPNKNLQKMSQTADTMSAGFDAQAKSSDLKNI